MEALVGWLRGKARGISRSGAGHGGHEVTPSGQLVHLVDVAAPGLLGPLGQQRDRPIGVNHQTADQAGSASTTAPW